MSETHNMELDDHITKKYDIKKRLGKGVSEFTYDNTVDVFNSNTVHTTYIVCMYIQITNKKD
jgi:hypothetical protein